MKLPPGVSKVKFDAVLRNLLNSPPMPLSSIGPKRKTKKSNGSTLLIPSEVKPPGG
jgi:hypothetical protein